MRRMLVVLVVILPLIIPVRMVAKANISKIKIKGVILNAAIEITDPKTLANFSVWTGPGTSWSNSSIPKAIGRFIADWSQGVTEHPKGLQRYEVSFYAKLRDERLVYVVFYEYESASGYGYVYLPGRTDEWYRLNTNTIIHGVEGRWFRAWSGWDSVAAPLIEAARVAALGIGSGQSLR